MSGWSPTTKMKSLGLHTREDLDEKCWHETSEVMNEYLYFKATQPGSQHERLDINPDGPRSKARSMVGDHEVWYPKQVIEDLRLALLAGGHMPGTAESDYWFRIQTNSSYRRFKHAQIRALRRERRREEEDVESEGHTLELWRKPA